MAKLGGRIAVVTGACSGIGRAIAACSRARARARRRRSRRRRGRGGGRGEFARHGVRTAAVAAGRRRRAGGQGRVRRHRRRARRDRHPRQQRRHRHDQPGSRHADRDVRRHDPRSTCGAPSSARARCSRRCGARAGDGSSTCRPSSRTRARRHGALLRRQGRDHGLHQVAGLRGRPRRHHGQLRSTRARSTRRCSKRCRRTGSRRRASELPIGRFGDVDEIAPAALLLASDEGSYFVGASFNPNGGDYMI